MMMMMMMMMKNVAFLPTSDDGSDDVYSLVPHLISLDVGLHVRDVVSRS